MKHFKTYLAAMALALSGCQSATDSCEYRIVVCPTGKSLDGIFTYR